MKLIEILTGSMSYDSSWAIYAEKINGEFCNESPARFGQTQFENGGLLDDCEKFATNDAAWDAIENWCDGCEDASIREEAAEQYISDVNSWQ